ncbi:MAG TPA: dTMP kinase [Candidatus Limnocylindria bacterium]|nr:dTMP kinase [Candidatus Limnocylindria bacterium]
MKRGLFLSFEGGEGSGKSLQARRLAETLTESGREVVLTREPGGTAAGERIRDILLHAREIPLSPAAQVLLFSSARAQLVREVIRPALEAGKIVIADRFFDSTVVYQGHAHGVPLQAIREVTALAVGTLVPDRTFLLDVPVEVGLARSGWRAEARWDRFEADATEFHVRVRDAYLRLAAAEPRRFVVIAADRDEAAIAKDIRREVDALLGAPA